MKKRKFLALVLCLVVCLSVVTGCNLISRNDKAYFEAIVCTITFADGTKDEITKRELLMGYNSYGYNYEQNYGQTRKEAIKTTLDSIVDQHLTIKATRDYYANKGQELFNGRETTYLWDQTYSSIYGNFKSYYQNVTGEKSTSGDNSSTDSSSAYIPYEKKVYLDEIEVENKFPKPELDESGKIQKDENGNIKYEKDENGDIVYETEISTKLVLKTTQTASTIRDGNDLKYAERTVPTANGEVLNLESESGDSKEYMYQCFANLFEGKGKEARNWKSAFNKYLSDIKENYSYIEFENDKECFLFEINRVYEIMRNNYIVEKYSLIYNQSAHQDADTSTVTVGNILDYYASKVRADYQTYKNDREGFDSKILSDVANMDYIYNGQDQSNFFYVGYVKMAFDEKQKAAYDAAQKLTGERKEKALNNVYDSVYASIRDDKGEKTGEIIYAQNLLQTIQSKLNRYSYHEVKDTDNVEDVDVHNKEVEILKAEAFRDFMYNYNDDDTLKNAEFNTVVGVNNNGEAVLPSTFSDNEEVKKAIVALYNNGNAKVGDLSTLVRADDGMYLFFYAGDVKNIFAVGENFSPASKDDNIKVLATTRMNVFSNKTYLDKLYEELQSDKFYVFQNMNIQNLRKNLATKIVANETNFKDLY